jgi:hypothetical protein
MDREARIWKFARLLLAKHGKGAFDLAHARAQDRLNKGDHRISSGWARVADILKRMTRTGARRLPADQMGEPPLDDVLTGQTTKFMMKADNVDRQELDRVWQDVRQVRPWEGCRTFCSSGCFALKIAVSRRWASGGRCLVLAHYGRAGRSPEFPVSA